ncbi:MAG: hypothetical protein ACI9VX_001163, partial [Dinoroseobacter sp.]
HRIRHFADLQNLRRRPKLFVPNSLHRNSPLTK